MGRADHVSRRLKLRQLNALLAVIEHGSMARAAQSLSVSQPVVSKAIADLEQTLGVKLLDRGTRGVEPTFYGRAFAKRSTVVFDELRTSVTELEHLADPTSGDLRIGSTEAMGTGLLPVIIDRISRRYPRINFDVVLAQPWALQERELRGRRIDLFIGQRVMSQADAEDLEVTVLYRERLNVVSAKMHPLARRRKIALADLLDERWCLPPPSHPVGALVFEAFRRSGLRPPNSVVTGGSAPFTSSLLANGQYIGILGSAFLAVHTPQSPLQVLPVRLPIADWPISIATMKNRAINPVAGLFIDYAREVARPLGRGGSIR
jgi:DNA-binding transcriptional LysR family regulator